MLGVFSSIFQASHEFILPSECKQLLGAPPYGHLKASSSLPYRHKHSCQPNDGFILSNKGWCPKKRYGKFPRVEFDLEISSGLPLNCFEFQVADHWLELDVGHPTLITGLTTKGRGDTNKNHWVTRYKVSYSNDSVLWTYYKDANHLEPKVSQLPSSEVQR